MRIVRREFLVLAVGSLSLSARIASAQSYPNRPVRIICGFPPGGPADIAARLAAGWLSERLGQSFFVENRPGAASNVATEAVAKAVPDGYTLLLTTTTNAINATYYADLKFDFLRDIVPIAGIVSVPNVMLVNLSLPANTLADFVRYARAKAGKINMGSGGAGTASHMTGELFNMMAGVKMIHVPYHGTAPALMDLMRGELQVMFDALSSSIGFIKANKIRALAVTSARRLGALPGVPTIAESIRGYEATAWQGLAAPKGTPQEALAVINAAMNAAFVDDNFMAKLAGLAGAALTGSSAQFSAFTASEVKKWQNVVNFTGLKTR